VTYEKAAGGAGVILGIPHPTKLQMISQIRNTSVGHGRGISAGGFANLNDFKKLPVGTIQATEETAWRELTEEIPDIEKVITRGDFIQSSFPIKGGQMIVRTEDVNEIHICNFFGLWINPSEAQHILQLGVNLEEVDAIDIIDLPLPRMGEAMTAEYVMQCYPNFYWRHECVAIAGLINEWWRS
jgi:hypothetical protein